MPPIVPVPCTRIGSSGLWPKAGAAANRLAMRLESSFLLISVSPYRVKNWPRAPGAFEPWIAVWQLLHARVTRRVLTPGLGCPTRFGGQFSTPLDADVSPGAQLNPPAAP